MHAASLRDGTAVVVKVQRPHALAQVSPDLEILARLARSLDRNAPWARRLGARELVRGFAGSLREELDYRVEMDNMAAMRAALGRGAVRIPRVFTELSTSRLIVMERFDAVPVAQADAVVATLSPAARAATARTLLDSVLRQIVADGVFHADLHPGNVVLWPDGAVGLLDFGSVGRLDSVSRATLASLLSAIDADDPVRATDALIELLDRPAGLDERALQRSLGQLITRFRGGLGSGGSAAVFSELFALVLEHGFSVPPAVAAALRSLGALDGTLRLLDPDVDLVAQARSLGADAIGEMDAARLKQEAGVRLMRLLPVLEALPRRLDKITDDLERGRFTAHVRMVSHSDDRRFLNDLAQQIVTAVLAGSAVLGGILLVGTPGGPMALPDVSVYALLGWLLGFAGSVLALRGVASLFGRRR